MISTFVVRPTGFGPNEQTAPTNRFQRLPSRPVEEVRARAMAEHDQLVVDLRAAGIGVVVVDSSPADAPDAVFPNNWVSFHRDGTVVLYPLLAPSRRAERRWDVVAAVAAESRFAVRRVVDLTGYEAHERFLEGTGSLVLDRQHRVAYGACSPRTDATVAERWAGELGYELILFDAVVDGYPVYHTNVLLSVGTSFVIVADQAIVARDRERVLGRLVAGRSLVRIPLEAMRSFGANVLELTGGDGTRVLAASAAAWGALSGLGVTAEALGVARVVAVPFATIEEVGGGSVRCALAEVRQRSPARP